MYVVFPSCYNMGDQRVTNRSVTFRVLRGLPNSQLWFLYALICGLLAYKNITAYYETLRTTNYTSIYFKLTVVNNIRSYLRISNLNKF